MRCCFLLAGVITVVFGSSLAWAAEIKVLTAGAFKPVVAAVIIDFEKQSGHRFTKLAKSSLSPKPCW